MPTLNNTDHNACFELRAVKEVVFAVQSAIGNTHPEYASILEAVGERLDDIDWEFQNLIKSNQN
ncbi:MAG: hypothetical protein LPH21_15860 [Shewanella sp.]|nr:hypothetical protein [Shewanella sp.]